LVGRGSGIAHLANRGHWLLYTPCPQRRLSAEPNECYPWLSPPCSSIIAKPLIPIEDKPHAGATARRSFRRSASLVNSSTVLRASFRVVQEPRPTGAAPQSTLNQELETMGQGWLTSANNRSLASAGVFKPQQFCKPHFVSFDSSPLNGLSEIRLAPVLINPVGFLPVFTYSTT
jgi:hypothetical protein